jgi:hypothetical protein
VQAARNQRNQRAIRKQDEVVDEQPQRAESACNQRAAPAYRVSMQSMCRVSVQSQRAESACNQRAAPARRVSMQSACRVSVQSQRAESACRVSVQSQHAINVQSQYDAPVSSLAALTMLTQTAVTERAKRSAIPPFDSVLPANGLPVTETSYQAHLGMYGK